MLNDTSFLTLNYMNLLYKVFPNLTCNKNPITTDNLIGQ